MQCSVFLWIRTEEIFKNFFKQKEAALLKKPLTIMSATYIKLKEGQFYDQKDKANERALGTIQGSVEGLYYKEEVWEGVPFDKLYLTIKNDQGYFSYGVRTEDSIYSKLVGFLRSADLKQPLELSGAFLPDQKGVPRNTVFIKQNGVNMKSSMKSADLPSWEKVKVGKKEIWNKEPQLDAIRKIVESELIPQVPKFERTETPSQNAPIAPQEDQSENLPF